jgi:UTP--glucose-1-phosphate uridylyltransferase
MNTSNLADEKNMKKNKMNLKKVIIPVAGKGTRFLPATKEIPKEMIPLVNRPMIDYAVEEALLAGFEEVILITSADKTSIENYFDRNLALEYFLEKNKKLKELEMVRHIGEKVKVVSVRQKEALGLGHAIAAASNLIGRDEYFAISLADDLIFSEGENVFLQMKKVFYEYPCEGVIGVMNIPLEHVSKYGVIAGKEVAPKIFHTHSMVEKPLPSEAPSTLATPGRYILPFELVECLKNLKPGAGGEYQLTDALAQLMLKLPIYAHEFEGKRFDTGNILGFLQATVFTGLKDPQYGKEFKNFLKEVLDL